MGLILKNNLSTVDQYVVGTSDLNAKSYIEFAEKFGLFETESLIFDHYVSKNARILDLGCGTGRTGFALYDKGYENILACDISPHMIAAARQYAAAHQYPLEFAIADARALNYNDASFDTVFFSYNGIMMIPGFEDRLKVFQEARRLLKPGGRFIFSSYRRDMNTKYDDFWNAEAARWAQGLQNPSLHEFGDIIKTTQIEKSSVFVHFPDQNEIDQYLHKSGFKSVQTVACVETDPDLSALINRLEYYVLEA